MKIKMKTTLTKSKVTEYIANEFSENQIVVKESSFELHDDFSKIEVKPTIEGMNNRRSLLGLSVTEIISMSQSLYFKTAMSGFEYDIFFQANYSKMKYNGAWNGFNGQNLLPFGKFDFWEDSAESSIFGSKTIAEMQELRPKLDELRGYGYSNVIKNKKVKPIFKGLDSISDDEIIVVTSLGDVKKSEFKKENFHSKYGRGLFNIYIPEGYECVKKCSSFLKNGVEYFYAGSENYTLQDIINYIGVPQKNTQ